MKKRRRRKMSFGRCDTTTCNNTLPRGGIFWEICPLRRFAISRAERCKLPRVAYFPIHPDPRQCIAILFSKGGVYWKLHPKEPGSIDSISIQYTPALQKECYLVSDLGPIVNLLCHSLIPSLRKSLAKSCLNEIED